MKIKVTQAHIERGLRKNRNSCPIALAVAEATGWYKGGKVSPLANTVGGVLVDHKTAKVMYDLGLLDEKELGEL